MKPLGQRIFNDLTIVSLFLLLTSGLAFFLIPRDSKVLTFARAHGHYWELTIVDGTYSMLMIGDYTRDESPHWIAQSVFSHPPSDPWRIVYIEPRGYCVIGPDQKSMVAPWPKGWPSDTLTGRSVPYHLIEIPAYLPPLYSAVLPTIWLALKLARPAIDRYHQRRSATLQLCANCGYDLRATPHRCPECGTIPPKKENISS